MKRTLFLAVLAYGLSSAPSPAAQAEGSFDRTLNVSGAVDLDVQTGSGHITVRAGNASTVSIHGIIHVRENWRGSKSAEQKVREIESNPPIQQTGNVVRIGHLEDPELRRNVSIAYEITTPAESKARLNTGSGRVTIEGIRGPVNATTGSGGMNISQVAGDVRAHTGSGRIELDSVQGTVDAHTGSGSIEGSRVSGKIIADTGSGHVRLEQTVGGDIDAHTGSGGITIRTPAQAAFDLRAHTGSGHIEVQRPMTVRGTIGPRDLEAKVGGGGSTIVAARTGSGTIRIE
jgi:putative adhesin